MLGPASSVPLPSSENYLLSQAFFDRFKLLHGSMKESLWKVERRQEYQEPGVSSLEAYIRGDKAEAVKLLRDAYYEDKWTSYALHRARENIPMVRIRVVERPLTPYLEWEFLTYQISSQYGERILIADVTDQPGSSPLRGGRDFVMFDRKIVLAHNYEPAGLLDGAWVIDEERQCAQYGRYFTTMLQHSIPLASFIARHRLPLLGFVDGKS